MGDELGAYNGSHREEQRQRQDKAIFKVKESGRYVGGGRDAGAGEAARDRACNAH